MANLLDTFTGPDGQHLSEHVADSGHVWTPYPGSTYIALSGGYAQYYSGGRYWTELGFADTEATFIWGGLYSNDAVWLRFSMDENTFVDGLKIHRSGYSLRVTDTTYMDGSITIGTLALEPQPFTRCVVTVLLVGNQLTLSFSTTEIGPAADRSATYTVPRAHPGTQLALAPITSNSFSYLDEVRAVEIAAPAPTFLDMAATLAVGLTVSAALTSSPMVWVDLAADLGMALALDAELTSDNDLVVAGVTARVRVSTPVGIPRVVDAGGLYANPLQISGASGSILLSYQAGVEPGEPALAADGVAATMWLEYTATEPGELYVTVDAGHYLESFLRTADDASIVELEPLSVAAAVDYSDDTDVPTAVYSVTDDEFVVPTSTDEVVLLRSYPRGSASSWTLTWTFVPRVPQLVVEVLPLDQAPGQLIVTVSNADPFELVSFELPNEDEAFLEDADGSGVLDRISVPVEEALAAGVYDMQVSGSSGRTETVSFEVLMDPEPRPDPLPPPFPAPQDPPPVRWTFHRPNGAAFEQHIFPYNPSEASGQYAPQVFSVRTTTSPRGQILTWEAAPRPRDWTLTGYLDTQDWYEVLEEAVASNVRYWLSDHHGRWWLVSIESFDPVYRRSILPDGSLNNWSFNYTLTLLVYRERVS